MVVPGHAGNDAPVLWPKEAPALRIGEMTAQRNPICPACGTGDLITISMSITDDRDVSFTTCHLCEAKWWFKDDDLVPLASVIGLVSAK